MFAGLFLGLKSFFSGLLSTIVGVVKNLLVWVTSSIENMVITALVVLVIFLSIGIHSRNVDIEKLTNDLNETKSALIYVQNALKQNAVYYNTQIKNYETKAPLIVVKHNTIYKEIEGSNATLKDKVFNYVKRMRDENITNSSK